MRSEISCWLNRLRQSLTDAAKNDVISSIIGLLPGTLVPKATKAIAVMVSFRPTVHPKWDAKSPITAVRIPIPRMEITKVG